MSDRSILSVSDDNDESIVSSSEHKLGFSSIDIRKYPSMLGAWGLEVPLNSFAAKYLLDIFEDRAIKKSFYKGNYSWGILIRRNNKQNSKI